MLLLEAVVVQATTTREMLCTGTLQQIPFWSRQTLSPFAEWHVLVHREGDCDSIWSEDLSRLRTKPSSELTRLKRGETNFLDLTCMAQKLIWVCQYILGLTCHPKPALGCFFLSQFQEPRDDHRKARAAPDLLGKFLDYQLVSGCVLA